MSNNTCRRGSQPLHFAGAALCGLILSTAIAATAARAAAEDKEPSPLNKALNLEPIELGVFVDTYYAHSFNDFKPRTRDYLTQVARDREPNVNLAYVEAKWSTDDFRGRLAGQVGTSVDVNYAAEPEYGWRYLQEAWAGYKLSDKLWLDAGVYWSHIGMENFVSKANWAYTRHLMSEYSPYYESGAKLTYQWSDEIAVQVHALNGWQNITDFGNNQHPALGTQIAYTGKDGIAFSYNTYLGSVGEGMRFYNDFVFTKSLTKLVDIGASFDVGLQQRDDSHSHSEDTWITWAVVSRLNFTDDLKGVLRAEQLYDRYNAIISTPNDKPFETTGFSAGVDYQLYSDLWWRNEYRIFVAKDAIFRTHRDGYKDTEQFAVTSVSYSF